MEGSAMPIEQDDRYVPGGPKLENVFAPIEDTDWDQKEATVRVNCSRRTHCFTKVEESYNSTYIG